MIREVCVDFCLRFIDHQLWFIVLLVLLILLNTHLHRLQGWVWSRVQLGKLVVAAPIHQQPSKGATITTKHISASKLHSFARSRVASGTGGSSGTSLASSLRGNGAVRARWPRAAPRGNQDQARGRGNWVGLRRRAGDAPARQRALRQNDSRGAIVVTQAAGSEAEKPSTPRQRRAPRGDLRVRVAADVAVAAVDFDAVGQRWRRRQ